MSRSRSGSAVVERLLGQFGTTWSAEAGFTVRNTPAPLFRLLVLSLLLSARIDSETAVKAARALAEAGWTTPAKMDASNWGARTRVLNRSGYARYDESTARMLEATTTLVIERWRGDLRNLREEAGRKEAGERALLKQCKGIGDVGADIFFREVQGVWPELRPFLDARALRAAERLGLGSTPKAVARHVDDAELPRLAAALVRVDRVDGYREVIG